MLLSVITPVYYKSIPYLEDTYNSLLEQTYNNWEWVIILNNRGAVPDHFANDSRIKVYTVEDDDVAHNKIGRIKKYACKRATGDIYIELDSDDILTNNALQEVYLAFQNSSTAMVYSNSASFKDSTWESPMYSEAYGWKYRPFFYKDKVLNEAISWSISPQMLRYIFWAPDHIRAWRASAYNAIGGHDETIKTGDDHDLCCRFYIEYGSSGIVHIDKCLYLYRLHENNSCVTNNQEVQEQTLKNYLKYSRAMAIKWSIENNTQRLDLGGRINAWHNFTTVDLMDADVITNLNDPWPFADNSVGIIRASHIFEHLKDPIHTMNEAFRVLAPGGWLFIEVPSTDGRGAFQDPTHVSFWNENSFWYYTNKEFAKFIPDYTGRFQSSRVVTYFPSDFERVHNIPVVQADLIAVKGNYADRHVGEVLI